MLFLLFLWLADPQGAVTLLQRGLVSLSKGQNTEARTLLEQASQADGNNAYVWSSLAEVYRRTNASDRAATAAAKAEKLGGSDPLVCHALAIYYTEAGHPEHAAPLEEKFARSPRADSAALSRTASLYLAAGQPDRALPLAKEAADRDSSATAENVYGRALLAAGQEAQALPYLKKSWESNPSEETSTFDYVTALLRMQSFSEAASIVTQTLKSHPPDAQLELLLGVAQYGQRRFDEAIATFLEVIRLDPDVPQPYTFLGRLLEQAGSHLPEIVKADANWAGRNPRDATAQLELAKSLLQQDHNNPRAPDLLRTAIGLHPDNWESHYQLGVYLESKRDFPAAETELRRSTELDPNQAMPHYHLARVYDRLGRPTDAEEQRAIHTRLTAEPKAGPGDH